MLHFYLTINTVIMVLSVQILYRHIGISMWDNLRRTSCSVNIFGVKLQTICSVILIGGHIYCTILNLLNLVFLWRCAARSAAPRLFVCSASLLLSRNPQCHSMPGNTNPPSNFRGADSLIVKCLNSWTCCLWCHYYEWDDHTIDNNDSYKLTASHCVVFHKWVNETMKLWSTIISVILRSYNQAYQPLRDNMGCTGHYGIQWTPFPVTFFLTVCTQLRISTHYRRAL